jgi:trans-2,3-dihydro-3-hydroxyanthranilate isomerase
MRKIPYYLLDVFTNSQFGGNPLAVFTETAEIEEPEYQKLAAELNLSETVFVEKPESAEALRRLRIFTPRAELPLAGHPVVGTWNLLASQGLVDLEEAVASDKAVKEEFSGMEKYLFKHETKAGIFPITLIKAGDKVESVIMDQGLPQFGKEIVDRGLVARALNLDETDLLAAKPVMAVNTAVPVLMVPLASRDALAKAKAAPALFEELAAQDEMVGVYAFCLKEGDFDEGILVSSRGFFPALGIIEDAATGSASGALGSYLVEHELIDCKTSTAFLNEQGIEMGRPSLINIEISRKGNKINRVRVGGASVLMGKAEMLLK